MKPRMIMYQGYEVDPLKLWAMLLGCAEIDDYGREVNAKGEPIMDDNFRYLAGRSQEHRRWPLFDIYLMSANQVISQDEYDHLVPIGRKLDCDFRPYLSVTQGHQEYHRIYYSYSETTEDIAEFIRQSILDGTAPVIRILKELYGEDDYGNAPGSLYHYRDVILDATRQAIECDRYRRSGITNMLLMQIEKGYVNSVEQYQLVWLQSIRVESMSYQNMRNLGVTELETLRRFVTADTEALTDWFGQNLDGLRWAGGGHFPALIDGEVNYDQRRLIGGEDTFKTSRLIDPVDFRRGQLAYLQEKFRPEIVERLRAFFRDNANTLARCYATEDIRAARERLKSALQTFRA